MTIEAAQLLRCIKERAASLTQAVCSLSLFFSHSHGREMETEELKRPWFSTLLPVEKAAPNSLWKGSERLIGSSGYAGFPTAAPYLIFSVLPPSASVVPCSPWGVCVYVCVQPKDTSCGAFLNLFLLNQSMDELKILAPYIHKWQFDQQLKFYLRPAWWTLRGNQGKFCATSSVCEKPILRKLRATYSLLTWAHALLCWIGFTD